MSVYSSRSVHACSKTLQSVHSKQPRSASVLSGPFHGLFHRLDSFELLSVSGDQDDGVVVRFP